MFFLRCVGRVSGELDSVGVDSLEIRKSSDISGGLLSRAGENRETILCIVSLGVTPDELTIAAWYVEVAGSNPRFYFRPCH